MQTPVYEKRGYLNEEYRFFAISAKGRPEMNYHYHEFHKLIFIKGELKWQRKTKPYKEPNGSTFCVIFRHLSAR